jgi:PqqD family protein of HPr-rel-A system
MLWHLNPLVDLSWKRWEEEWVVFDSGSGQTHLMDALTAATLMTIEVGEIDFSGLAAQTSETLMINDGPELHKALNDIVNRLVAVGLISSQTS